MLSMGNSALWRVAVQRAIDPQPGERILDVAAGTGTSSASLARSGATVVAVDFSPGMIDEGRKRNPQIEFVEADAQKLPFGDDEFDVVTISFGLRNVADPKAALAEMYRVLKPGGRLLVCEFSHPPQALIRGGYELYLRRAMPMIAKVSSSNPDAYTYLARVDRRVARPEHAQPMDPRCRVHARRPSQPHRGHRGAPPRAEAGGPGDPRRQRSSQIGRPVNPSPPLARRSKTLSSSLGLGEKLFASSEERAFATAIEEGLEEVEAGLLAQMSFADDLADVTSRYLLEAGGKRVRPTLALLTAQLGSGANPAVITAAQAVEITHVASLYHDDVMDEAQMRRGVPTAQTVWGNSVAILTGDLLFARASKLIASLGERALTVQTDTFERLCLGQLHETIGPRPGEDPIAHYLQVLADKTGSLIAGAALVGVIFSDAPKEYREPVELFGERIGVAFQLIDDVLDLSSEVEATGKAAGTDLRAGVPTLPLLYLRRAAETDPASADLLARLERAAESDESGPAFSAAVAELRDHEVTRDTLTEAHRWADQAVAALAPLPEGPVKKALTKFAEVIVERSS